MTIASFTQSEFIEFLKANKFETVDDQHWDEYQRIVIRKDGITFAFQLKKIDSFILVVELCKDFDIEPPEHLHKPYVQWMEQKNKGK
jgi:hypothetical protein